MRRAFGAKAAAAAMAALLVACQGGTPAAEPEGKSVRRPPQPACDQARTALTQWERDRGFLFEESGEAMVDRQSWMRLGDSARDEVIETLAVVAACRADVPQADFEISIRDEAGLVLKSTRVAPRTDYRAK